tara:strand:- start:8418 stop:10112 length:1695 start_codon:yes stop_codon:yes gene_type:complete
MKLFPYYTLLPNFLKLKLLIIIFIIFLTTFTELLSIALLIPLLTIMFSGSLNIEFLNINNISIEFNSIIIFIIIAYTFKLIFLTYSSYYQQDFLRLFKNTISKKLLKYFLTKPYPFFIKNHSTRLIQDLNDIGLMTKYSASEILFISELLILATLTIFLLIYDPYLTVMAFLFLFSISIVINFFIYRKSKYFGEQRLLNDRNKLKNLKEGFDGIKEIKLFGLENYFYYKFKKLIEHGSSLELWHSFILTLPRLIVEYLLIIVIITAIISINIFSSNFYDYIPVLTVFIVASLRIAPSLMKIVNARQNIAFNNAVIKNTIKKSFLKSSVNIKNINLKKNKNLIFKKNIIIKNLDFSYNGASKKTLNKLNLIIKKNSLVGIYGPSGSGKTTLISLIMGLLSPDKGNILVDNIDIQSKIKSWQNIIAYVPQKIFLVDDTIENNIALGEEENIIDKKKLKISAKKSGLDLDTMFYKGGKTMVGESGVRLSSGQIQRIGIARALYKNSEILILDEFTSSLDKKNEEKIMKTIIDLKKTHTIIMISHNSELVKLCDKKIFISSKKAIITK